MKNMVRRTKNVAMHKKWYIYGLSKRKNPPQAFLNLCEGSQNDQENYGR